MKTKILHLDPHDDVTSARDKMGWGQTNRILLVYPERGQVLNRRLDLTLLQRHSNSLGAQLALVTRDSEARFNARELGIPVFKTLRQAQSQHWRPPRQFRHKQHHATPLETESERERTLPTRPERMPAQPSLGIRLAFFTLGVASVLALAAILVPGARVDLQPEAREQSVRFESRANPATENFNLSGALPAQITSVIIEGRDTLTATGSVEFPLQTAKGEVRFTNLTEEPVVIPEGSIVRTTGDDAARFATSRTGEIPGGPGQTLSLPVQALAAGRTGNQPAGSIQAIEGDLGTQATVTNLLPTYGGKDRQTPAPSLADQRALQERLSASLQRTALEEIQAGLAPGDVVITDSLRLVETLEAQFWPPDIQPADQLDLSLRLKFEAMTVSTQDIQALAKSVLDANLPQDFHPVEGSLEIEHLSIPSLGEDGSASWKLEARRRIQKNFSENQIVHAILGLAPAAAKERLASSMQLETEPRIAVTPSWWPRLPVMPFRINVTTWEQGNALQ
jgi:hypothetical protein